MKQLVRDPKSRPIIFVSPIVQMILLGYAATTDVKDISTMVVDHDQHRRVARAGRGVQGDRLLHHHEAQRSGTRMS